MWKCHPALIKLPPLSAAPSFFRGCCAHLYFLYFFFITSESFKGSLNQSLPLSSKTKNLFLLIFPKAWSSYNKITVYTVFIPDVDLYDFASVGSKGITRPLFIQSFSHVSAWSYLVKQTRLGSLKGYKGSYKKGLGSILFYQSIIPKP